MREETSCDRFSSSDVVLYTSAETDTCGLVRSVGVVAIWAGCSGKNSCACGIGAVAASTDASASACAWSVVLLIVMVACAWLTQAIRQMRKTYVRQHG